ncbi:hypothetical protein EI983_12075 [Roseovarius faecimaris]|uniref:TFIIB-type zinc ribbon-containing protein n=1 Tax=Roseovarius faecimaris TaxID=2494550 RepID=A0A6I6J2H6_9RHOB|nr:hypothetical protein [Roseovarius faecimaris]QGX98968.1 hypothetical protein EI983_12075 [Roseovarius faecimaris]
MPHNVKIATCCYCGTRAALVLDRARHELACRACGAPLHEMKMMPKHQEDDRKIGVPTQVGRSKPAIAATTKRQKPKKSEKYEPRPARKKSRSRRIVKRGWGRKLMEELWDVVEDVFD